MRKSAMMMTALVGALLGMPGRARAQLQISVAFGARLGPPVEVFAYSRDRYGDWRRDYDRWTPVVVYDVNGRYYRDGVPGAREVIVYRYHDDYFFPPDDRAWVGIDHRYDYRHRPDDDDWGRAHPYEVRMAVDSRLGAEIAVWGYSADRAGDWHDHYREWTPVTVYEYRGRYYPHPIAGTRAVAVYRYGHEYFLPPRDAAWAGADRRFDYRHQPTADDRARVHGHEPGPPADRGRAQGRGHDKGKRRGGG